MTFVVDEAARALLLLDQLPQEEHVASRQPPHPVGAVGFGR